MLDFAKKDFHTSSFNVLAIINKITCDVYFLKTTYLVFEIYSKYKLISTQMLFQSHKCHNFAIPSSECSKNSNRDCWKMRSEFWQAVKYGNTGCGVFKRGVQNSKDFCLRINILKESYWILRIGWEVSKSAKIWHSKSIFCVKNYPNLSQFFFIKEYQFRSTFFVFDIFW